MRVPSRSELLESDSRGFRTNWVIDEDYRIEEGVIKPLAHGSPISARFRSGRVLRERYMPMTRPELPFEFAKLADGTEVTILNFVRRYGLLGYSQAFESTIEIYKMFEFLVNAPRGSAKAKTSTKLPDFGELIHPEGHKGDPVAWVVAHAETVQFLIELNEALHQKKQLREKIEQITTIGKAWPLQYGYAIRGQLQKTVCQNRQYDKESDSDLLRRIITQILNANLNGGVSREVLVDMEPGARDPSFVSTFAANSLVDAIYWHLANAFVGGSIKKCVYCKRFFNATHLKRKYCPPTKGFSGEGACAQNDRARRKRGTNPTSRKAQVR